jgi:hypothetical protein
MILGRLVYTRTASGDNNSRAASMVGAIALPVG